MTEQSELIAREAFIQSILYHSRTERTSNYIRIIQGLQTYALERSSWHVEEVLTDINTGQGPGFSELLGIFGMAPGALGRAAKGLKILDFGNRAVENLSSKSKGVKTDQLEAYVRGMVDDIWSRTEKDPALREAINKFMPDNLGKVGDNYQAIIDASPQFSDHLKLKMLQALAATTNQTLETIQQDLKELKEKVDALYQARLSEEQYQKELQQIEEYSTYGKLAARLIAFKDPELGRRVGVGVEAYRNAATVAAAHAAGKITNGLATANYVLIAISFADAFFASGDDGLSKALADLQDLIVQVTKQILSRLDDLENRLLDIQQSLSIMYREMLEQGREIRDLHLKVDEMEGLFSRKTDLLINATRAGFGRELDAAVVKAIGHKDMWQPGYYQLAESDFRDLLFTLYSHAAVHSSDALSTALEHRSYEADQLLKELDVIDLPGSIPYLSLAITKFSGKAFPKVNVDPGMWLISTATLLDMLGDWPKYQQGIDTTFLKEVRSRGESIIRFLDSCYVSNAVSSYKSIVNQAFVAYKNYVDSVVVNAPNAFLKVLQGGGSTNPQTLAALNWQNFNSASFPELFATGDMGLKPFNISVHYVYGNWGRITTTVPIQVITDYFPPIAKCAAWLGATFTGHYKHSSRSTGNFGSGVVDFEFYVDLNIQFPNEAAARTYRIIWGKIARSQNVGGMQVPMTPAQFAQSAIIGLLSERGSHDTYKTQVDDALKKLQGDLSTFFVAPCRQASQLLLIDAERLEATRKHLKIYYGLLELLWRCVIISSGEHARNMLEKYFIGSELPSDLLEDIMCSHTAMEKVNAADTTLQSLKKVIENIPAAETDVARFSKWSVLGIRETYDRLNQCIAAISSGKKWKTEYGLRQESAKAIS
jgi:hypothetical protein